MLILASASPRRKQLMEEISSSFNVVISEIDESLSFNKYKNVHYIIKDISLRKCSAIAKDYPKDIVISADTVVVIDKEIIGKPKDQKDAFKILNKLSNRHHVVYTAYTIKQNDFFVQNIVKSTVYFNPLSDELINLYIASGSPMDKAGAYGFQDNKNFPLVKRVVGSISNVIGFPLEAIKADLEKFFAFKCLR